MESRIGEASAGLLEEFRRALSPRGRAAHGRFLIEGTRLHERALRSGTVPDAVLVSEQLARDASPRIVGLLEELRRTVPRVCCVKPALLTEFTEGRDIGAVVGLVSRPATPTLVEIEQQAGDGPLRVLVAVDVEEPGNVGALVRTALASGAAALVTVGRGDPFHPKAVRTSMGSLFRLPLSHFARPEGLLSELGRLGFHRVAAVSRGGAPPSRAGLSAHRLALFVGSEAFGLPGELLDRMDQTATIAMASSVDSYSVNAAAAVLLYEASRG